MKKAKKIFKRMCLNNWGGITHQILEFHEYVNLFSGMSVYHLQDFQLRPATLLSDVS